MIEILLKNKCVVDCEDSRGFTPLMMAASEGYINTVKLLVNAGANVNKIAQSSGECVMHMAVRQDNVDLIKFLLESGVDGNHKGNPFFFFFSFFYLFFYKIFFSFYFFLFLFFIFN